jgi:hypothetical protein
MGPKYTETAHLLLERGSRILPVPRPYLSDAYEFTVA